MKKFSVIEWITAGFVILIILGLVMPLFTFSSKGDKVELIGDKPRFTIQYGGGNASFKIYVVEDTKEDKKYIVFRGMECIEVLPLDESKAEVEE